VTALAMLTLAARSAPADESAKPAKKDSAPILRPKEVKFTASVEPATAKPGDTVVYSVTAKIDPNWHVYKYAKTDPGDGPMATKFDFFDLSGLKIVGDWTASKEPVSKPEPAFNNMVVEFYEDEVTWSIKLLVPEGTEAGKKTLRNQINFQVCDPKSCKQGRITVPRVELTVSASAGASRDAGKADVIAARSKDASPPPTAPVAAAVESSSRSSAGTTAAPASASSEPVSEVAQKAAQGIVPFLIFSALGGLFALVMPCVWPMVPITVNFFVKQGHASKGRGTTGLAIVYCLAIIGVFTAVGVLFSFFFSAGSLQKLANNGWLNLVVAGLFVAFGLSLLGVFDISLPTFLLNASSRGESRGGLIGVMFMALTLTITSFTCTFPVVGGLLVMAAGGHFFYPIIGLATFATVLALPFFLLALAPGFLAKMPKSGDWMNAVKIVGGLVEIGAAFKFINTAEIGFGATPDDTWFDAPLVLSIWVIMAAVCGIYLLGLFRTDHDHEAVKVGPGRLLGGSAFLVLALFLAPALFGRPPQSRVWYELVGLFPPDVGKLSANTSRGAASPDEKDAISSDPEIAETEQKNFHGVLWGMSYKAAIEQARAKRRPILIDFTGVNCANCRKMEQFVLPRPEVVKLLGEFVTIQLFTDFVPLKPLTQAQREALAEKNAEFLVKLTNDPSNPSYVAIEPDGKVLAKLGGYNPPSVFVDFLNKALDEHRDAGKVASY
jgi:thiol:disulfide interchange protein DsbD